MNRIGAVVLAITALCAHSLVAAERFRPIHGDEAAYAHYLVTLAADVADDGVGSIAEELARTYGGRLEPYAAAGFHGFAIVMRPSAARLLSADPRVTVVEEQATSEAIPTQRPAAAAIPSARAPSVMTQSPPAPQPAFRPAASSSPSEPWSGAYQYDGAGNIKAIGSNQYQYDGVGRLVSATAITAAQSWVQTYRYDSFGNLLSTSVNDGVTPVVAAAADSSTNRIDHAASCPSGSTCLVGTFDEAGNETGNGVATYAWDTMNMMTDLQAPGRHDIYVYDIDDQRVATVNYSDATSQVWHYTLRDLDNKVVRQVTATVNGGAPAWHWDRDYVYRGASLLAVTLPTSARLHFHLDHLGTPRLITDDQGEKRALHTYWPYGLEAAGSDHDTELMKFAGNERDSDDPANAGALDYMHARYYAPVGGRFLSLDFGPPHPLLPQSWNRFAYTMDNPLLRFDPTGADGVLGFLSSAAEHLHNSFDIKLVIGYETRNGSSFEIKGSPLEGTLKVEANAGDTSGLVSQHFEMTLVGEKGGLWPLGGDGNPQSGIQINAGVGQVTVTQDGTKAELHKVIPVFPPPAEEAAELAAAEEAPELLAAAGGGEDFAGVGFEPTIDLMEVMGFLNDIGMAGDAAWDEMADAWAAIDNDVYNLYTNDFGISNQYGNALAPVN